MEDSIPEQENAPKGGCDPMGSSCSAGSWKDLWTCGERSPHWSRFPGSTYDPVEDLCGSSLFLKNCTLWKGPILEQFVKNCSPWEGLTLEKFTEECHPWEGPHTGAGEECEESSL